MTDTIALPDALSLAVSTTDAVPVLISFFDADHVCRFANEHHLHWYGKTPTELVGLHMREFLGDEAYDGRLPYLDLVAQGESVSFEAAVPHVEGGWREAAIRYVPRITPDGYEGFHTLVFDVSREQNRFHSVFDGTAIGFWEIDLTNVRHLVEELEARVPDIKAHIAGDLRIVRRALDETPVLTMNEKAMQILQVSLPTASGRSMGWWCPDESLDLWNRIFLAYLSGDSSFEGETVMRREDGALFDVLINCAFPKHPKEQVVVVVGLADISHRVARELTLARAQADLAHAARVSMLGELVASIAHEVNQPLAAVVTSGNAALRWLNRATPDLDEARVAIRELIGEANRASEIIVRTRRMASKGNGEAAGFGLQEMVCEAAEITRRQVDGLGASLTIAAGADDLEIVGDRIQLQQVIINLIVNAAQAMADQPDGSRRISIRQSVEDGHATVEVADTGPGFGSIEPARVFDAFYTTKKDGMGMGLSVSKSIVEGHRGTIDARAVDGGGTIFSMRIPIAQAACRS